MQYLLLIYGNEEGMKTATPGDREVMFNAYCVPCHGSKGEGDGLVVQHGYPAPPSLSSPATRAMSDLEIFSAITDGLGTMPSYGAQIAREDRWKAILHLRVLQAATQ